MVVDLRSRLGVTDEVIADFCRKHHIQTLWVFGSTLRPDFSDRSDIDVLVEFEDGHTPGLAFFGMETELSQILGRPVDFVTRNAVEASGNWIRKKEILGTARVIYPV